MRHASRLTPLASTRAHACAVHTPWWLTRSRERVSSHGHASAHATACANRLLVLTRRRRSRSSGWRPWTRSTRCSSPTSWRRRCRAAAVAAVASTAAGGMAVQRWLRQHPALRAALRPRAAPPAPAPHGACCSGRSAAGCQRRRCRCCPLPMAAPPAPLACGTVTTCVAHRAMRRAPHAWQHPPPGPRLACSCRHPMREPCRCVRRDRAEGINGPLRPC